MGHYPRRSEEDAETWSFLKIMFDEEARKQLLAHFGFSSQGLDQDKSEEQEDEKAAIEEPANLELTGTNSVEGPKISPTVSLDDNILAGADDGEDFFDRLEVPPTPTEPSASPTNANDTEDIVEAETEAVVAEPVNDDVNDGDNESDEAIQRALVAGNFKGAVDVCLGAGRMADALIMAAVGGTALWEKTQNEYFQRTKRPYLKVISFLFHQFHSFERFFELFSSRHLRISNNQRCITNQYDTYQPVSVAAL